MILLYEFPDRYESISNTFAGAIDGASWVTAGEVGAEGDTVPGGAAIYVRGWAPNLDIDGPASDVVVIVDGKQKHHARVGIGRADVANHFENDAMVRCGFETLVTTGRLAPGPHELVAYTVDAATRRYAKLVQTCTVTVAAEWTPFPGTFESRTVECSGVLDEIVDESREVVLDLGRGIVPAPRGAALRLRGWLFDPQASAPFERVYAVVDRERAYALTSGSARPDIAAAFGAPDGANAGFLGRLPTTDLRVGSHRVEIVGIAAGELIVPSPIGFELVVSSAVGAHRLLTDVAPAHLDDVVCVQLNHGIRSAAPLRLIRGDRLFVRGWAFDGNARDVASGVALMIDGKEHPALYGLPRPDVAAAQECPSLLHSGFTAEINTQQMAVGNYSAECLVLARDGRGAYGTAQHFEFEVAEA